VTRGQQDRRRQQCPTAPERRLASDFHQQEQYGRVKVAIEMTVGDGVRAAKNDRKNRNEREQERAHESSSPQRRNTPAL
jgi:hypothetical protein